MLNEIEKAVKLALKEDVGSGDITGHLVSESLEVKAYILTREPMVLCGVPWVNETFRQVCERLSCHGVVVDWIAQDGAVLDAHTVLCRLHGNARAILCAERTALNFLQMLSATATVTYHHVQQLAGTKTRLLDTRKTIPGHRDAQKYAVRCGGGDNHRLGLYDAFLIKENHIRACGSISQAIHQARHLHPKKKLEIEVETLNELHEALAMSPDVILLDNFNERKIKQAVAMRKEAQVENIAFEISGGVNLKSLKDLSRLGVEYISSGAITKNIQAIDLTLLIES